MCLSHKRKERIFLVLLVFEIQVTDRAAPQKIFEREEARKQENRERTPPVLSSTSSSRFVYEEAWEEDFDEHSQQ